MSDLPRSTAVKTIYNLHTPQTILAEGSDAIQGVSKSMISVSHQICLPITLYTEGEKDHPTESKMTRKTAQPRAPNDLKNARYVQAENNKNSRKGTGVIYA